MGASVCGLSIWIFCWYKPQNRGTHNTQHKKILVDKHTAHKHTDKQVMNTGQTNTASPLIYNQTVCERNNQFFIKDINLNDTSIPFFLYLGSGQLGDGRAISLGEIVNSAGERWELQLKGTHTTAHFI